MGIRCQRIVCILHNDNLYKPLFSVLFMEIPINKIKTNPHNPRKNFHKIDELAEDIKRNGLIQKILVRPVNDYYEIVQGERRFKALQLLRRDILDCEVRELTKEEAQRIALAENLQREDLSVIELAREFERRLKNTTQQELAKEIGKSQSYIVKILKFLELPKSIHFDLDCGVINMEQGRELLRYMKYLRMLRCSEEFINIIIGSFVDYLYCKESKDKSLREIIDENIFWRIRYALKKKGEEFEINGIKIIKEEEKIKITEDNIELLRFFILKSMEWCNHHFIDKEWDYDKDDYVECEPYCKDCGMLKGVNLKNLK